MTEKRFELTMSGNEVAQYEIIDHSQEILTVYNNLGNVYFSSAMKICELLNSLADENEQLKNRLKQTIHEINDYTCTIKQLQDKIDVKEALLKQYEEENEQLKQRNTNQYNQLDQLWQLIQAKDWETLTTMDNEMKENDERLKREWKCYE